MATIVPMKMLACALLLSSMASSVLAAEEAHPACVRDGTTEQRDACAYGDFADAVQALDRQYRSRLRTLREPDRKRLRADQMAWLVQRDPRCKEQFKTDEGGSIWFAKFHACLTEATQARIKQLKTGRPKAPR